MSKARRGVGNGCAGTGCTRVHTQAACGRVCLHTLTSQQNCAARRSQPLVTEYMQAKSEAQTLAREVAEWRRKLGVTEKFESVTSTWPKFEHAAGS